MLVVLYSPFTNYECGLVPRLPVQTHLALDVVVGGFLAASPWLFGFADRVWAPHLLLGLFSIPLPPPGGARAVGDPAVTPGA